MNKVAVIFFMIAGVVLMPLICYADSAEVLPKGIVSFNATYYHYLDIKERYDENGDPEPLATNYNAELNSGVLPGLVALDPLVASGSANIGTSVVDYKLMYRWSEFTLNYGVTDNLSIGVLIPYNYSKNEVKAKNDNSRANVVKNPCFNNDSDECNDAAGFGIPNDDSSPLIPRDFAEAVFPAVGIDGDFRLTTDDVQGIMGKGLDVNSDGVIDLPGYGYKRIETWSGSGVGDIEVGAKYKFYDKGDWRHAATIGVRLPTGEVDDPDNLTDVGFGDGQYDAILRLHSDYLGIKDLLLNATVRYDIQLPDRQVLRVPESPEFPLASAADKENVKRDLGDIIEFEVMGNYSFTPEISGGVTYCYTRQFKDEIEGDKGFHYESLEFETDTTSHMVFVSIGYSTMQMFMDKKFPVPLNLDITYRNRFAGENNVTRSQYISATAGVYF